MSYVSGSVVINSKSSIINRKSGRRIEKDVDGDTTTYVYDGGNVIAEYDDNDDLASKYIHGARVDELVCMIDVADSNAVYYYHYDGLGSVVALSNSSGDSCQSYVYSAFGRVWASDPNFTANPYMFTGRRFDYKTGLYYYRARYYNPYIGRFLQTDPVGYSAGINLYAYCRNNPLNFMDPSGLIAVAFYDGENDNDGGFAEAADDFLFNFDISECYNLGMQPLEYISFILETMNISDLPITEIYLFTHGSGPDSLDMCGAIYTETSIAFLDFCDDLKEFLDPNAIIHLRGCKQGELDENGNSTMIQTMAEKTGRNVTACEGNVIYMNHSLLYGWFFDGSSWEYTYGRDYEFGGNVYMSDPEGNISVYWEMQYERVVMFGPYFSQIIVNVPNPRYYIY